MKTRARCWCKAMGYLFGHHHRNCPLYAPHDCAWCKGVKR